MEIMVIETRWNEQFLINTLVKVYHRVILILDLMLSVDIKFLRRER